MFRVGGSYPCGEVDNNGNLLVAGYISDSTMSYMSSSTQDLLLMSFTKAGSWSWTSRRGDPEHLQGGFNVGEDQAVAVKAGPRGLLWVRERSEGEGLIHTHIISIPSWKTSSFP